MNDLPVGAACRIDPGGASVSLAEIPVGLDPEGVAVDSRRRRAYVACSRADYVAVGTRGTIVYEPILLGRDDNAIVLEVHPDIYRRGPPDAIAYVRAQTAARFPGEAIDWASVSRAVEEEAGVPRAISVPDTSHATVESDRRTGYE